MPMLLKELVEQLAPVSVEGTLDREVAGIAYDSRRVTPGTVFVAVRGENVDGHDYIHNALDRGASAIIYERNGFRAASGEDSRAGHSGGDGAGRDPFLREPEPSA